MTIMAPQISFLANVFYVVAAVLGLPSLLGILFSIVFGIRLWLLPVPPANAPVKNPDAIIMMLEGITRVIGIGAGFFSGVGKTMTVVIAVVSVVALTFAIVFFYTGRGLHNHQAWARVIAMLLLAVLLLLSLLVLLSMRMPMRLLPAMLAAAAIYALWTLWHAHAV